MAWPEDNALGLDLVCDRRDATVKGRGLGSASRFAILSPSRQPFAIGAQCHFGLGRSCRPPAWRMRSMITLIEEHRGLLRQLCQRYRVQRLEVFSSAVASRQNRLTQIRVLSESLVERDHFEIHRSGKGHQVGVVPDQARRWCREDASSRSRISAMRSLVRSIVPCSSEAKIGRTTGTGFWATRITGAS